MVDGSRLNVRRSNSGGNEAVDTDQPKPPLAIDPAKLMRERIEANDDAAAQPSGGGPAGAAAAEPGEMHEAVDQMFAKFQLAYHNQFRKAFPSKALLNRAKRFWHENLHRFSPALLYRATAELTTTSEFLPSLADVVGACRRGTALFGLPSTREAYQEACLKPPPKAAREWSHEAVYLAGCATGWQLLAGEPESASFPRFEYHYLELCRQVLEGAELQVERPEPLPPQVETELSREELRELAGELRRELGE